MIRRLLISLVITVGMIVALGLISMIAYWAATILTGYGVVLLFFMVMGSWYIAGDL